jgi:hypothetical protein
MRDGNDGFAEKVKKKRKREEEAGTQKVNYTH